MMGEMAGMPHTVVLARADVYADALVAAPLARRLSAPILLTGSTGLDARVREELQRLNADRVFVMGGTAALSQQVVNDLEAAGVTDIQRVDGADRFATAARVARMLGGTQAYLVKGIDEDPTRGWPDAVAVSGLAAAQLRPILLTATDFLPPATSEAIDALDTRNLSIVGGTAVVSEGIQTGLSDRIPYIERISGATRFETSAAVAERAVLHTMDPHSVWLATGHDFPDALAAGAAVGYAGGILLLVDGQADELNEAAAEWLDERYHPTDNVMLVGGRSAVSAELEASLGPDDEDDD
jgi:putative cell wall-binding protein